MLDESVSDIDTARTPLALPSPEIRVQPTDAILAPVVSKETGKRASDADAPSVPPAATAAPDLKIQPVDGLLGNVSLEDHERAPMPRGEPLVRPLLRSCAYTVAFATCCGLAWAAGAYHSLGHSPFDAANASRGPDAPQSPPRDDIAGAVRQMAEEVHALKTGIDGKGPAQQTSPSTPVQTTAGPAIAELAGRVDKLDAKLTAKLSQIDQQLAGIEQQISASRPAHVASAPRAQPPQKRARHPHDAFDPSIDPSAPGVPRPLGSR